MQIAALESRIHATEANAQSLQQQASDTMAAAKAAQAELQQMKAAPEQPGRRRRQRAPAASGTTVRGQRGQCLQPPSRSS